MSTKSADLGRRDNSPEPDGSTEKRSSKKRKVLSCYECRNRKMKCDRVYPTCGRCQKTGRLEQCSYDPRLLEHTQVPYGQPMSAEGPNTVINMQGITNLNDSSNALPSMMRMQQRRIEMLETKLAAMTGNKTPSRLKDVAAKKLVLKEQMVFRGRGFKTQFHGTTSVMSMISQYRALQAFTRETLTVENSMLQVKERFKGFRDRRKSLMKEKIAKTYGTDEEILALLPAKHEAEAQATKYFKTWEQKYRILHEPSFWREFNDFWRQRPGNQKNASFAAVIVLIAAATKCLDVKDDLFVGDSTVDRDAASSVIETCEMWLNRQPRKRLTLSFFQLQCLSLLAKRSSCVKLKQDWLTAGDVIRLALAAGMHRDPSLLASGRISEYEKEMKKRLWYTIAELELQSSFDSGLQSSLTGLYFDTPAPANLPDEAFSVETHEMPASEPIEHYTTTSYLNVALRSLPLRIDLTRLLNDPSSNLDYDDILHFDEQITSNLADIPAWEGPCASLPTALLRLQLLQYLLVLHKTYAAEAHSNKRWMYSFITSVEASSSIIATQQELNADGHLGLNHFRNDTIRVGMTLAQIVYYNCARHRLRPAIPKDEVHQNTSPDAGDHIADISVPPFPSKIGFAPPSLELDIAVLPREFLPRALITTSIEIVESSLHLLKEKVMRLGTGYMEYWLLSAALAMLPLLKQHPMIHQTPGTQINPMFVDMHGRCKTALDSFTSLALEVLARQSDPSNNMAPSMKYTFSDSSPSEVRTPSVRSHNRDVGGAASSLPNDDIRVSVMNDVGYEKGLDALSGSFDPLEDMNVDLSGWTFPDFWAFDLAGDF